MRERQELETSYLSGLGRTLFSVAIGAGAMYLLDPAEGPRRQSIVRDKIASNIKSAGLELRRSSRYTSNKVRGLAAKTASRFSSDNPPDEVVAERVRAAMGRVVSHPRALRVDARDSIVLLAGPILASEVSALLAAVRSVRGVRAIENHLEPHRPEDNLPALQGEGRLNRRAGERPYSPPVRVALAAGGTVLALRGFIRGGFTGYSLGIFGSSLLIRAWTNMSGRRLIGVGAGRHAVHIQKTITIRALREEVFNFFANYENFPSFMSNVRQVTGYADNTSHWIVRGPMGVDIEWDAQLTEFTPDEVIAWKTLDGQMIANSGKLSFAENPDGTTRVDVKLSYNPVAGALGHFVAKLFGADPKSELDQDLSRVKTTLETGMMPKRAAAPFRPEHGAPLF